MKVAIIGAGISGLAAGRRLLAMGIPAVVFEKSRGVGGRVATRRKEGFVWDTGATSIAPRGRAIRDVMRNELNSTELVPIVRPIYTHQALRVSPSTSKQVNERYTYATGINTLPKLLAEGQDIRFETTVGELVRQGDGFSILGESFDAVILTPPVPQAAALLWGIDESRPIAHALYRPCLSVNLGYLVPSPAVPYHALIDLDRAHPLTWLSLESLKSPGRAPEGGSAFGAQLSDSFSREHYTTPDEELVRIVAAYLEDLYGDAYRTPAASTVMRWKYAQPTGIASFSEVNPVGSRLILASDGLLGGHIEEAYDVGVMAANQVGSLL